jgi:D-alanine-D-alanine ligase
VLVICQDTALPPPEATVAERGETVRWKSPFDVISTLEGLGHAVDRLGIDDELAPIRRAIARGHPDIVFNLVEAFMGQRGYDQHVVSFLELIRVPYTGSGPRGLTLARDKALSKKILSYHRIAVPDFQVFPLGCRPRRRKALEFPLIVKSLVEDASFGISKASLVTSDEKLAERIAFVHEQVGTDAIVERFIDGRELYASVFGNQRLTILPTWELLMTKRAEEEPLIATEKAKWDLEYQARKGVRLSRAEGLSEELERSIARLSGRIYRTLGLDGYARLDYRLDGEGRLWFLEANPNPDIARDEEFASAAAASGIPYEELLEQLIRLGHKRRPAPGVAVES